MQHGFSELLKFAGFYLRPLALLPLLLSQAACDDTDSAEVSVRVDIELTQATIFGGDVPIAAVVSGCEGMVPVTIFVDNLPAVVASAVPVIALEFSDGIRESRDIVEVLVPGSTFTPAKFGLPAKAAVIVQVTCGGKTKASDPFDVAYVPTQYGLNPPFNPLRFWAGHNVGDLLACEGLVLRNYEGGTDPGAEVELSTPCSIADMRGADATERRYLVTSDLGLTAIDPGPLKPWSRAADLRAARAVAGEDPIVLYDFDGDYWMVSIDAATGEDIFPPIALTRPTAGDPMLDDLGNILVLEMERPSDRSTLTYFIHRFDAAGTDLGTVQAVHFNWAAPAYIAEFDATGRYLYTPVAVDDETNRWIQKIDLQDCNPDCTVIWQTSPADGWLHPLGEAGGRLLLASDTDFTWVDPITRDVLSAPFGPTSGISFTRATVEADGSIFMLANGSGNVSQGFYVFAADGSTLIEHTGIDLLFRWLTSGWSAGPLISFFGEVHMLDTAEGYAAAVAPIP